MYRNAILNTAHSIAQVTVKPVAVISIIVNLRANNTGSRYSTFFEFDLLWIEIIMITKKTVSLIYPTFVYSQAWGGTYDH